uniref:phycytochrome bilisome degradation protein n=1 Tax=Chroothece richteriana TaxID=101928 RepID=UPI001FCDEDA9|nr:phycytochrome bilisome degradation protein [Chroothece richteriana]UNJ14285.1 phycytochrome bilisome degradation protein [Chroothece richteriana]
MYKSMSNNLTLEQEFRLAVKYRKQIAKVKNIQSRKLLLVTLKRMMLQDNMIKFFIRNRNLNNNN